MHELKPIRNRDDGKYRTRSSGGQKFQPEGGKTDAEVA